MYYFRFQFLATSRSASRCLYATYIKPRWYFHLTILLATRLIRIGRLQSERTLQTTCYVFAEFYIDVVITHKEGSFAPSVPRFRRKQQIDNLEKKVAEESGLEFNFGGPVCVYRIARGA